MMARLIVVNSNSSGNAYAIEAGGEILLLEAGIRHSLMTRAIGFCDDKVVGCCVSHAHGDHAKYVEEYAKRGLHIYCNQDIREKKIFPFGSFTILETLNTVSVGSFRVCPIPLEHDVPCFGYLVHHPEMGNLLFATDTYKYDFFMSNIDHFLIEANYDDKILKANIEDGKIDRHQANRLMLSHMEIGNTIHFLHECNANQAKTITLCHLSERNSNSGDFKLRVSSEFSVPTYIAQKGTIVELSKEII